MKHQISIDEGETWRDLIPSTKPLQGSTKGCEEIERRVRAILTEKIPLENGWVKLKFQDIYETTTLKQDADTLTIGTEYEIKIVTPLHAL